MFKTEQENFWANDFGNDYQDRNQWNKFLANQLNYFSNILNNTSNIWTVLELWANIWMNLVALNLLLPETKLTAIEINTLACEKIEKNLWNKVNVINWSILDYSSDSKYDLVFTKWVLIHINPNELDKVYEVMYNSSNRYILLWEYYNPKPVSIEYRWYNDKLFKRDFCWDILNKYPDLELKSYWFNYHWDNNFQQDDITWFLLEKKHII